MHAGRDAGMRTAAGQGSASHDGRAKSFGRLRLLTQPGSADISVADAIGDTLPEGETGFA
jgi:hypothetical protein